MKVEARDFAELYAICLDVTQRVGHTARPDISSTEPRYKNPGAARKALHAHPKYVWLKKSLPKLMKAKAPHFHYDVIEEFWFIEDLIIELVPLGPRGAKKPGRERKRMSTDIDGVIQGLLKGLVKLTPNTLDLLYQLLYAARTEAQMPVPPAKKSRGYPQIENFARSFLRTHNLLRETAKPVELVLEFAQLADPRCDERTAQRYVEEARKG